MRAPQEIESEIEQTRNNMTGTLNAIERKFSPDRLVDEAVESMRNVNFFDSRAMDMVRDNPIPLALIGLGIGWFVLSSMRGRETAADFEAYAEEGADLASRGMESTEEWAGYGSGAGGGNGSERLSEMADKVRGRVGDIAGNIKETAEDFSEEAQSRLSRMGRRVTGLTSSARRTAGDWAGRGSDMFEDHPFAMGLLAVVAGVALAAAIPRTRREMEMMGDTSTDLLRSARQTGREALHKAGRVVQRAAEAVGEGGSQALRQTKEAVSDEARRQGLTAEGGGTATAH